MKNKLYKSLLIFSVYICWGAFSSFLGGSYDAIPIFAIFPTILTVYIWNKIDNKLFARNEKVD